MALPVPPLVLERRVERGVERHLLALLHRADSPRALEASPLMHAVCAEMQTRNPVDALKQMVRAAFPGDDERAVSLRDAIVKVDLERTMTNAELARRSGVSRRQFQRVRAKAVAHLARYAWNILNGKYRGTWHPQPNDDDVAGPRRARRLDARFECERAAFLRARRLGCALEMRAIAGNLLRLAQDRGARIVAMEWRAEANARLGRRDEALEQFRFLSESGRLAVAARLALLSDEPEEAQEYAQAALRASDHRTHERYQLLVLLSEALLARSAPWRAPAETQRLPLRSWERIAMESEEARHRAIEGQWAAAEHRARSTFRRAVSLGYQEQAARSAATLHACAADRGDSESALRWRARAVAFLLPTQDRVLGCGLFLFRAHHGERSMDPLLINVIYERLRVVVPQMLEESDAQRTAARELLTAVLDAFGCAQKHSPPIDRAMSLLVESDSAFCHYADKLRAPICEMLALAFGAVTGLGWSRSFEILEPLFAESLLRRPRNALRTIPVGISCDAKSQMGVMNHLRVDDEGSAGDERSAAACSDLRVRLLSLRTGARTAHARHGGGPVARAPGAFADLADSS
ncbi:MAG: hypothetical protein JO104_11770 [Candidatus Eremiobacteraeota bacterium]|nr:hypothetical protein [Candidatus Eremiobacteraeota bacterium]